MLPKEFDYRTHRTKDRFISLPVTLSAANALFELVVSKSGSVWLPIGISFLFGLVCCGIGYGLRCLLKKEYTVLVTQVGKLTIAKDRQHDEIVKELQARRLAALRRAVVVSRLLPPWVEVKKFKWLRDEGVITDEDFETYRSHILSRADTSTAMPAERPAVH